MLRYLVLGIGSFRNSWPLASYADDITLLFWE